MRDEIANLVYPVLDHGMGLKDRLERSLSPDFELEQMELKRLLGSEGDARRLSDYGGESVIGHSVGVPRGGQRGSDVFLGIRYALVCCLRPPLSLGHRRRHSLPGS
jgi:hypothetical protein